MRRNGVVIDSEFSLAHQLIATLDVSGKFDQGMNHPELSNGQRHLNLLPCDGKTVDIEDDITAMQNIFGPTRKLHRLEPSK